MSTVKITDLNPITHLNINTDDTLLVGVDVLTDVTGQITATVLAEGLYSHNPLNVGNNELISANTIGQFASNSEYYLQVNLQNYKSNGSADFIATSDIGTDFNNYIDLGINNSTYNDPNYSAMKAMDGYLYVQGPNAYANTGNLVIGTASYGANLIFIAGGTTSSNVVAVINEDYVQVYQPVIVNAVQHDVEDLTPAFTINNTGTNNTFVVNDDASDTTPFVIDASGNTSIGTSSANGYKLFVSGNTYFLGNVATSGTLTLSDGSPAVSNNWVKSNFLANTNTITVVNNIVIPGNITTYGTETRYGNIISHGTQTWNGNTFNYGVTFLGGQLIPAYANVSLGSASAPFNNIYTSNSSILFSNSDLSISGTLHVLDPTGANNNFYVSNTGYSVLRTSVPVVGRAVLQISGNPSSTIIPVANTQVGGMIHLTGANTGATIITIDNFDSTAPTLAAGVIAFRRFRGTVDVPGSVQSGDALGGLVALGAFSNGTSNVVSSSSSSYGRIQFIATENYTSSNNGQKIIFNAVPNGSNVAQTALTVTSDGIIANSANLGTFTITDSVIYSSNTSGDINFGLLTATGNLNFNRTTVFNKQVTANAGIILTDAGVYQYSTSNNATVTQLTDKSTAVTANGRTGQITTTAASLASGRSVSFTVNNDQIVSAKDVVIVNIASGATASTYSVSVTGVSPGSFIITIGNNSSAAQADTLVINFAIIRVN